MTAEHASTRVTAILLFFGLSFSYIALAPGSVGGRGYIPEELDSGSRMLEIFTTTMKGRTVPPMIWSRHGPITVLMDLPFIKVGKLFVSPDFVLSLEACLLTAALVAVLFLWLRKLCSPGMSLLLSLTAAFGTMLWPYAYIGLETKQSFFLLLAGYLALANGRLQGWLKLMLLALVCGLAMTMKATGIVMWPAFAFLLWVQFRDRWRTNAAQWLACGFVIAAIEALATWGWKFYWLPRGGSSTNLSPWVIQNPLQFFSNAIGLFGSPTKGLLVFAPILIVSLYMLPKAFRENRNVAVFAMLVTATMGGFMSLLIVGADEVWGSRFMHCAIAPLILCIGAAAPRYQWKRHAPVVALAIIGVMVSFLGAFYYYGAVKFAQAKAGQYTMEWQYGDPVWNEVTFDARLLRVWLKDGNSPVLWVPTHIWIWPPPPGTPPWPAINLRDYSKPQAFLLQTWNQPKDGVILTVFRLFVAAAFAGPLLLIGTVVRTVRAP